jgi:lipopolysaccharide heptosyltransferase I
MRVAPPASVLIVRLSALGDVVHTLPALAHLRAALPDAKLGWVVEDRCAALLQDHPHLDRLHVVPRRALAEAGRGFRLATAARMLAGVRRELAAEHYALACDFQGNLKSAVVGWLAGADERLGFAPPDCREGSHLVTTRRIEELPEDLNRIEKYVVLARAAAGLPGGGGGVERVAAPVVPVAAAARARAEAWWAAAGPAPRVLLAPGSSARMPEKRWPRYPALAAALAAHGRTVGVAYGAGEAPLAAAVRDACPAAAVPAAPPALADLVALVATADAFVGNDSAPTHLAAQLGRPTVALFGPTDPARFAPWGPRVHVVRATAPCAACARGAVRGDDTHGCLPALDPAEVRAAVDAALAP